MADSILEPKFYQKPNFISYAAIGVLIVCVIVLVVLVIYYSSLASDCQTNYKGSIEENKKIIADLEKLKKRISELEAEAIDLNTKLGKSNQQSALLQDKYDNAMANIANAVQIVDIIRKYMKDGSLGSKTVEEHKLFLADMDSVERKNTFKRPFTSEHILGLLEVINQTKAQIDELILSLKTCNDDKQLLQKTNGELSAQLEKVNQDYKLMESGVIKSYDLLQKANKEDEDFNFTAEERRIIYDGWAYYSSNTPKNNDSAYIYAVLSGIMMKSIDQRTTINRLRQELVTCKNELNTARYVAPVK